MADTEQLEAVLAQWRDATTPLDGTTRVDTSLFAPGSARSALRSSSRALSGSAHTSELSVVPHSRSTAGAVSDARETSCRPWSHDDFLARAATFSIATWFAKPDAISVFACARHGWVNTAQPDELYCPSCEQRLCFTIDPALSEQGALRVASAFAAQLPTGHAHLCPWRENPSPVAFTTLPVASLDQVRESLVKRMEQLLATCTGDRALSTAIRALELRPDAVARVLKHDTPQRDGAREAPTAAVAQRLATAFAHVVGPTDRDEVTTAALMLHVALLGVCGWRVDAPSDCEYVAMCEMCSRRWRIATYSRSLESAAVDQSESDETSERAAKRQKTAASSTEPLDLMAQHRWFCPWVRARTAEASHDRSVESDALARYGENDAKLWAFTLLPGWQQHAKALGHIGRSNATVPTNSLAEAAQSGSDDGQETTTGAAAGPEQALESVRAVLGLPEW